MPTGSSSAGPVLESSNTLTEEQDEFPGHLRLHLHHRGRHRRDLLVPPARGLHLPVGGGGWRSSLREALRLHRRVVEYYCVDHVLRQWVESNTG